jgi:hypothetical protein
LWRQPQSDGECSSDGNAKSSRDTYELSFKPDVEVAPSQGSPSSGAQQTIVPLVPGMTVTTADVVGNVEVRARSHGPGFCAVGATGGDGSASILAPPLAWSTWTVLFSHLNQTTATIDSTIECGTGTDLEIRYWK